MLCCSGDLSVSKNSSRLSPEHWRDPSCSPRESFQVCECLCITIAGQRGWARGSLSHLAAHPGEKKNPVVGHTRSGLGCCSVLLLFVLLEDLLGNK